MDARIVNSGAYFHLEQHGETISYKAPGETSVDITAVVTRPTSRDERSDIGTITSVSLRVEVAAYDADDLGYLASVSTRGVLTIDDEPYAIKTVSPRPINGLWHIEARAVDLKELTRPDRRRR